MIIFDLDGTLADITHRRHLVEKNDRGKSPNWDLFYRECVKDAPMTDVIGLFLTLYKAGKILQIWSGRSDEVRAQTYAWLQSNVFKQYPARYWSDSTSPRFVHVEMRSAGDYTPDDKLKEAWLDIALNKGEVIEFAVDDRNRIVDMWRRRGITCLQCAPGDF